MNVGLKKVDSRLWIASPAMHDEEQAYEKEAFDTSWFSTVGANFDALKKGICKSWRSSLKEN